MMTSSQHLRRKELEVAGMSSGKVLVYGAGGHGKVVIDILERAGECEVVGVLDDDPALTGLVFLGYRVLGGLGLLRRQPPASNVILAIGDNPARRRLAEELRRLDITAMVAIHPSAQIGKDVSIGEGTVVMAGAVVNSSTKVGCHCILNTGSTVDHDCCIGDYVHICPGAHLAGGVGVGDGALVGVGACVIPDVTIGAGSTIGAGAAVVCDIPPDVAAVGVPARVVQARE